MPIESHYHLPLVSTVPRPLVHRYLRLADRGDYYEQYFTTWTLRRMCRNLRWVLRKPDAAAAQ